ncbi:MAG: phosphate ABC transporter permease [Acidobacteria bacterium]|nr:MAG: phosphate ABC transporter permease [Acidobacteriota bacterium]
MSTTSSNRAGALESPITDTQSAPPAKTTTHDPEAHRLPDEPLVTIQPGKSWGALNLRDIWHYRELLYFLTWRDIKVRYKQATLGVAWIVMQPLLSTLVFTIFLGVLARVPSDGVPYPLFVFAGLMPWTFFASGVSGSSNSLVGSANLITKVYFPRMIIPGASIGARLLDFLISFAVFAGLMLYYGVRPTWGLLWLPVFVALLTLLSLAVGMWASAVNVKYRDVGAVLPVLIQFWMFASPVVYPSSLIYSRGLAPVWQRLYTLNPMVGILDNFRAALLGVPFNWAALAVSVAFTLALLVYAAYDFRRMERSFADIV